MEEIEEITVFLYYNGNYTLKTKKKMHVEEGKVAERCSFLGNVVQSFRRRGVGFDQKQG